MLESGTGCWLLLLMLVLVLDIWRQLSNIRLHGRWEQYYYRAVLIGI